MASALLECFGGEGLRHGLHEGELQHVGSGAGFVLKALLAEEVLGQFGAGGHPHQAAVLLLGLTRSPLDQLSLSSKQHIENNYFSNGF
jgi:hypothetical protein